MGNAVSDSLKAVNETISGLWWPHINQTASMVALGIAGIILIIAQFAGARDNRTQIILGTVISTIIGIFTMPLLIKLGGYLGILQNKWGIVALLVIMMIYVAAIALHVYEITTVTAREARPPD